MTKFILRNLSFFIILFATLEVYGKPTNVLKLSCEYDPNLIKKETKNVDSLATDKLDTSLICRSYYCKDIVEVNTEVKSNGKAEYRMRNSWFNHQGILLDDFLITKNTISIVTFVSQAYFLESYVINRVTGKAKRTFFRFNDSKFFNNIRKLGKNNKNDKPLFNEKGKLSLKTIKSFSLEPSETFYFEGQCLEGTGV